MFTSSTFTYTVANISLSLGISLFLAITACILRLTNGLIWFTILMPALTSLFTSNPRIPISDYFIFLREGIICGLSVLAISGVSDYLYFGTLTFPPYQWLTYNVSLDLAVFYGRNDWHYYLSQGLPLLLTTYLPFTLVGFWNSTKGRGILSLLTVTVLTTIGALSQISHKEVRFIYPLLPLLHIISAPSIFSCKYQSPSTTPFMNQTNNPVFHTKTTITKHAPPFPSNPTTTTQTSLTRKPLLALLLLTNLGIAYYTTQIHQSGVLSVLPYLRSEYESLALDTRGVLLSSPNANFYATSENPAKTTDYEDSETFVGFLMPCHSTPWRSGLFYPELKAWALTCEPPIDVCFFSFSILPA